MSHIHTRIDCDVPSVGALFLDRVRTSGDREAFRYRDGPNWTSMTWADAAVRVEALAAGLLALGIAPEQRVGIASTTRIEWILADLAVMCAGAATTTVYANTKAEDTAYILGDAECRIVFAENPSQLAKLAAHRNELAELSHVVLFDGVPDDDWAMTLDDLASLGAEYLQAHPQCVRDTVAAITPDRLATIIYTSGTTGVPKGVRLRHGAWVYQGAAVAALDVLGTDDLQLLWLPLAHSFGKVLLAAQLSCGFVSAIDSRLDAIATNCAEVRPTFMAGVPRVFEKAHSRLLMTAHSQGLLARSLLGRALDVAQAVGDRRRAGIAVPLRLRAEYALWNRSVLTKLRNVFGGRIRFFVSGSAPLNRDIAEWFLDAGMLILEGYGLTETSGAAFINTPAQYKLGTVGRPLPGTQARIGDDDEIQILGPNVMDGYHGLTALSVAALTDDGWLHTGDCGDIDADGFLTVTGRIKDMFKTSGGKYVVPTAIEAKFIAKCPYVSQFLVFGESHRYCVALIALDPDAIGAWAGSHGLNASSYDELTKAPEVLDLIDNYVSQLNRDLNSWETIKKWAILDRDLSVETGELTPSLKVKRPIVFARNSELLESLYQ
ncbi:long-chain fatty acid--CoA ligase [Mycolicibacterium sp. Y3]